MDENPKGPTLGVPFPGVRDHTSCCIPTFQTDLNISLYPKVPTHIVIGEWWAEELQHQFNLCGARKTKNVDWLNLLFAWQYCPTCESYAFNSEMVLTASLMNKAVLRTNQLWFPFVWAQKIPIWPTNQSAKNNSSHTGVSNTKQPTVLGHILLAFTPPFVSATRIRAAIKNPILVTDF